MEDSKSSEQPRCPCGFYGSSKTMGLCSRCYKAHLEKSKDALKSTPDHMIPSSDSSRVTVNSTTLTEPSSSREETPTISDKGLSICGTSSSTDMFTKDTLMNTIGCKSIDSPGTSAGSVTQTPEKKGNKRDISSVEPESTPESTPEKQPQKIKKRCFQCKSKLELAQRQIGKCKCENVFCALHRLPELHNCDFDHKEDGRREAREKMVKPVRHLGTSFKRLDTDT